jgi:cyclohexa-1,5-dienecarbonyl-CoA hydratase
MAYQFIATSIENGRATLTLKRDPLNVLNIAMMEEMNDFLKTLQKTSFKVLVLQGEGKAFSAGWMWGNTWETWPPG